ncbi:oxidoreductase [Streptomyces ipomoeae]|jgi:NADPH2:quinone reductase|uniref:Oxidoreductase, zinc-binding dehydrogenase family protein n=2 Tax=Streptomyces ipomoeae TaxID=103232 RepID=L1KP51_9ACTN|nr:zinc-binding dehydrogenase [Streptomyces ipomoeae]EKX62168.1 oxidoreductase, zinc-binding dehydrogenase family protein [Streptomyces ipomoeae 91-03]MDX2697604.1 zinc-binding dehydrogenase [Streptomyces ipomoeae]MDX2825077.1 zinc-binding dehydrogenase [Streptomyces ipomoeae]MDX2843413.1 zinc-binding dehydrogenase [Streptomyces ipomoeae]MDX2877644.1 zinc-binding dehydrogenase [Streptomyces ipomoeae]
MHAIRLHTFGPAENLTYEKVEDPEPGPGQVRIAVAAAGVHLLDAALREGHPGPGPAPALPTVPGREVAGVVEALGEGAPEEWLGKRVVAHLGFAPGGYAELAVTDAGRLHEIPENLDPAEAVAMIGTGRTTMGILLFAEPGPDDVVVIPAAAGGIGTLLVQYAKNAGATVIGLAGGPEKTARVAANGADLAVDYTDPAWPERVAAYRGKVTVVFDGVGGAVARESVALLAPGGKHLVFGWSADGIKGGEPYVVEGVSESVLGEEMRRRAGGDDPIRTLELRALAEAAAGRLVPAVHRFPLAQAATAHRALENRGTTGKVVLEP